MQGICKLIVYVSQDTAVQVLPGSQVGPVFVTSAVTEIVVDAYDDTKGAVCWKAGDPWACKVVILTDTSVTFPAAALGSGSTVATLLSLRSLTASKAVLCYQSGGSSQQCTVILKDADNALSSSASPLVVRAANTNAISNAKLSANLAVVCATTVISGTTSLKCNGLRVAGSAVILGEWAGSTAELTVPDAGANPTFLHALGTPPDADKCSFVLSYKDAPSHHATLLAVGTVGIVADGAKCNYVLSGYHCTSVTCTQAAFSASSICTPACSWNLMPAAPVIDGLTASHGCNTCSSPPPMGSALTVSTGSPSADYPTKIQLVMLTAIIGVECMVTAADATRCWGLTRTDQSLAKAPAAGVLYLAGAPLGPTPMARLSDSAGIICNAVTQGAGCRAFAVTSGAVVFGASGIDTYSWGVSSNWALTSMSATHALACYTGCPDAPGCGASTAGICKSLVYSNQGTALTVHPGHQTGPIFTETAGSAQVVVASFTDVKAVVCWIVGAASRHCRLIVLDGTILTYPQAPVGFGNGAVTYSSIAGLSSHKAILCYNQAASSLKCQAISRGSRTSGLALTLAIGPAYTVQPNSRIWVSVAKRDALRATVCGVQTGTVLVCSMIQIVGGMSLVKGGDFAMSDAGNNPSHVQVSSVAGTELCAQLICFKATNHAGKCIVVGSASDGARSGNICPYRLEGYICGRVQCNAGVWSARAYCVGPPTPTPRPTATPTPPPQAPDALDGGPLFPDGEGPDDQTNKEAKEDLTPGNGKNRAVITNEDGVMCLKLLILPAACLLVVVVWRGIFPPRKHRTGQPGASLA